MLNVIYLKVANMLYKNDGRRESRCQQRTDAIAVDTIIVLLCSFLIESADPCQ